MNIIVDARSPDSFKKIFSISLVERIIRQLCILRDQPHVIILIAPHAEKHFLRNDFKKHFNATIDTVENIEIPWDALNSHIDNETILWVESNAVYDHRVFEALIQTETAQVITDDRSDIPLAFRSDISNFKSLASKNPTSFSSSHLRGHLKALELSTLSSYIRFLRRSVPPVLIRINAQTSIKQIENLLYENTFKGAMEFIAIYGYRLPVREMTRWVARTSITPNHITGLAVLCSFAAIPCFWLGYLWAGLILAASFIVLDSLDGKLARLTFRLSHVADRVDHLTSLPTRIGWYSGMGWYFSMGQWDSITGIAGMALTFFPILDKFNLNFCNYWFGKSLLDFSPLDRRIHLFTARRNDIFLMIVGSAMGFACESFFIIVLWVVLTWLWHILRLIWLTTTVKKQKS